MLAPPPLRLGDRVAVVAPSSPFDVEKYREGAAWLATRYELVVRDDLLAREGYLAGSDERRLVELRDALASADVRAIVAARGGFGATRIAHRLDWAAFAREPKWIVGFSDVTALHVEAARVGVRSIHAPMVAFLGGAPAAREPFVACLEGRAIPAWHGLSRVVGGTARGPAFGGNLALIAACAAAGRVRVPEGAVIVLEDCTERPYRLDRMLTSLRVGGFFDRASAIVVGGLTDCAPGPDGVTAESVVAEHLRALGLPSLMGAPFGHGDQNAPFVLGAPAVVEADAGIVRFS